MREFDVGVIPDVVEKLTWEEWKLAFQSCSNQYHAIGLLHGIFDADTGADFEHDSYDIKQERISMLLDLANGHNCREKTKNTEIQKQAFQVLATKFFKYRDYKKMSSVSEELRKKLFWFFLPHQDRWDWNIGSTNDYAVELAILYLQDFCLHFWGDIRCPSEIRASALELYYNCGWLDKIHTNSADDWKLFTDEMLVKLEELALRDVETIEVGVLLGNPAARLLVLARAARNELDRREKKQQLELVIAQSRAELAKI